jgi:hypothetical protein
MRGNRYVSLRSIQGSLPTLYMREKCEGWSWSDRARKGCSWVIASCRGASGSLRRGSELLVVLRVELLSESIELAMAVTVK